MPYLLSVLSGLFIFLSFPKWNLSFLAWIALVPVLWTAAPDGRKSFRTGWLAGLSSFAAMLYWILPTFQAARVSAWVGIFSLGLLAAFLAFYNGIFTMLLSRTLVALSPGRWIFFGAALWAALEWLRGFMFSGFPWGLLGYSQWKIPFNFQIAEWTGVYGVSAMIVLFNLILLRGLRDRQWNRPALAVLAGVFAANAFLFQRERGRAAGPAIGIAILQGNVDQYEKWSSKYVNGIRANYQELALQAAGEPKPELIVWPETAVPGWIPQETELYEWAAQVVRQTGAAHLMGAVTKEGGKSYNSAFLFAADGNEIGRYDKIHLVPFGEYVPFQSVLGKIVGVLNELGGFDSGPAGKILELGEGKAKLGINICYEAVFPELIRKQAANGAQLLVNITNDGWYLDTAAPEQHFAMNALRAVETRRSVVRAANTGISGIFSPLGTVAQSTQLGERTVLRGTAPLRSDRTLYARFGNVFIWICAAFALWICVSQRLFKRSQH